MLRWFTALSLAILGLWTEADALVGYGESGVFVLSIKHAHVSWEESDVLVLNLRGLYLGCGGYGESNVFMLDTRGIGVYHTISLTTLDLDPNPEVSVGMSGGTVYRYYRIMGPNGLPVDATNIELTLSSDGRKFTPHVRLAGGILELGLEVDKLDIPEGGIRELSFPSTVMLEGRRVSLTSVPPPFKVRRIPRRYTRRWDVFAGGSAGVTGTIGSIGAGATVAAARLSVKGEGGMGITVAKEYPEGTFVLSRRLESSVAASLQSPGVGIPIGKVNVGTGAEVSAKSLISQTLKFDVTSPEEAKIGQAGFLLETFSLGGLALGPEVGLVLNAITFCLNASTGAYEVLQKALYEEAVGVGFEGSVGAGFGVKVGPVDLKFAEGSAGIATLLKLVENVREDTEERSYESTLGLSLNTLGAGFKVFEIGTQLGVDYSTCVGQAMSFDSEGRAYLYSLWVSSSDARRLSMYREIRSLTSKVEIEGEVLRRMLSEKGSRNLYSLAFGNPLLLGTVALALDILQTMKKAEEVSQELGEKAFDYKFEEERGRLIDLSIGVSLEAALGAGLGIYLGVRGRYFDATDILTEEGIGLGDSSYALCKYSWDGYIDESEDFSQVCEELLSDVVFLVREAIRRFYQATQKVVQKGMETVVEVATETGETVASLVAEAGSLTEGYIVELSHYEPFTPRRVMEASGRYVAKKAYITDRVYHRFPGPSGKVVAKPVKTVLVIISDAFVVSVKDSSGRSVTEFDPPLTLALKVKDEYLERFGFSPEDRDKVRVYAYDDSTLSWTLIGGEVDEEGIIRVKITHAGTYALGIEKEIKDTTPPKIEELTPEEGSTVSPWPVLKARVSDEEGGSGVELSSVKMFLDGQEVPASYDLGTGELVYTVTDTLTPGEHTLRVEAGDQAGNITYAEVSFVVRALLAGDFDGDGMVDFDDFLAFVAHFGTSSGEEGFEEEFDLTGDGKIDFDDFFAFVSNFGRTSPAKAVPKEVRPVVYAKVEEKAGEVEVELSSQGFGFGVEVEYDPEGYEFLGADVSSELPLLAKDEVGRLYFGCVSDGARLRFRMRDGLGGRLRVVRAVVYDGVRTMSAEVLGEEIASKFALGMCRPNPFNPRTVIEYYVGEGTRVRLEVYDVLGRLVRVLVDGYQEVGRHRVVWDGRDGDGRAIAGGVYFVRMEAGGFEAVRKVVLVK